MDRFVVGYTLRCSIRCRQLLFGVALASIWLSRPATLGSGVRPLRHDSYAVYCPQFDENTHLHTHTLTHTHTHMASLRVPTGIMATVINRAIYSRLALLSARVAVTFTAAECHGCCLCRTTLCCVMTGARSWTENT